MSFIDADSAKMADDLQLNRQQNEAVVSQQKTEEDPSSKGVCVLSNIILCLYMTVHVYCALIKLCVCLLSR